MAESGTRGTGRRGSDAPARQGSGRPTLRTIAELTGLNVTTISRALNNAPELNAETRQRIQRIAAELGYVPDRTALRLKTGRTHVLGLLLDQHEELLGFGHALVSGLAEALRGTSYHLVITPSFRDSAPLDPIRYILRNRAADGVIFSRTEPDDPRVRLLLDEDFPFVTHGRTRFAEPHPFVDYDNFAFAHHGAMRLAEKGRTRLCLLLPPPRFTFGEHLRDGFAAAAAEAGFAAEHFAGVSLDSTAAEIRLATMDRLSRPHAPDGFVCGSDTAALGVIAGATDLGLVIGRDVDVVAKQTSGIFSLVRPRVDTIYEDTVLAGRQLGDLLLRRIQGESPKNLQILQEPILWE